MPKTIYGFTVVTYPRNADAEGAVSTTTRAFESNEAMRRALIELNLNEYQEVDTFETPLES